MRILMAIILSLVSLGVYAAEPFVISSPAVTSTNIPAKFTCDGINVSPELNWTGIPTQTKSLALVVYDPDAPSGTFYHWVLYNIPPTTNSLPEGAQPLPEGAIAVENNMGFKGYYGPCPPRGETHRYIFLLSAMSRKLNLPDNADIKTVISFIKEYSLGDTRLTSTYKR